uniref:Protein kinase domain-containing protein n=1 Tax=Phytophthora ramorum TaxID=164328 RepID=H3HDR0_PHYRM
MAPEVLEGKDYSFSSDVWALGCVLYELCTGKPPFTANNTPQLLNKICHGDYIPIQKRGNLATSRLPTLVASMLSARPERRPSLDQILRDSLARIQMRRYCVDRLRSTSMTDEERRVMMQQMTALAARERERQEHIVFALEKLQQLRLQLPASKANLGRSNSVPKELGFTGIPRPGVPLTGMAKSFTSRRPPAMQSVAASQAIPCYPPFASAPGSHAKLHQMTAFVVSWEDVVAPMSFLAKRVGLRPTRSSLEAAKVAYLQDRYLQQALASVEEEAIELLRTTAAMGPVFVVTEKSARYMEITCAAFFPRLAHWLANADLATATNTEFYRVRVICTIVVCDAHGASSSAAGELMKAQQQLQRRESGTLGLVSISAAATNEAASVRACDVAPHLIPKAVHVPGGDPSSALNLEHFFAQLRTLQGYVVLAAGHATAFSMTLHLKLLPPSCFAMLSPVTQAEASTSIDMNSRLHKKKSGADVFRSCSAFPEYFARVLDYRQMDVDATFYQMVTLCVQPAKVYKSAYYRKQTKNRWARDDPAFAVIQFAFLLVATVAWAVAFRVDSAAKLASLLFHAVVVEWLGFGLVISTLCWWIANHQLRQRNQGMGDALYVEQRVEWQFAFDIHCNSFFIMFLFLYVLQFLLAPMLASDSFLMLVVGNLLYSLGWGFYTYITFLGYMALPFLHRTEQLLFPLIVILALFISTVVLQAVFGAQINFVHISTHYYYAP